MGELAFSARGRAIGHKPLAIINLEASGKPHKAFCVIGPFRLRDNERIDDGIINEARSDCPRVAYVGELDWGRALRQGRQATVRVALAGRGW